MDFELPQQEGEVDEGAAPDVGVQSGTTPFHGSLGSAGHAGHGFRRRAP